MKQTAASLCTLLLLCLCLVACRQAPYPAVLRQADSLLRTRPDSAMALLRQAAPLMPQQPEATRMYYRLLCVKAADKAYVPHTSDSLIRPVIAYYEEHWDKRHLPEAYYYGGRVYRDLGDAPQALDYLQRALDILPQGEGDMQKSKIYSQMAMLFLYQHMYDEALNILRKAHAHNVATGNVRSRIFNLRDMADAFRGNNQMDSALYYFRKSYDLACDNGMADLANMVQSQIASMYDLLGEYNKAREALQQAFKYKHKASQSAIYSIAADIYLHCGQVDSALYYNTRLLAMGNVYGKRAAYMDLAQMAMENNDAKKALEYLRGYALYTDSVEQMTDMETVRRMHALYNYQLREKENRELEAKNARQHLWMVYATAAVLLLIAFSLLQYQYNRRKRLRLAVQVEKLKLLERAQYERSKAYIEENEREIAALEKELQESQTANDELRKELLLAEREQIIAQNNKAKADRKEQELAIVKFKQSEIYAKFHRAAYEHSVKIEEQDWELLREELDICYKNFTSRLNALVGPLSCINLRICLLIKAGIYMTGISLLVGREKSTIVSARKKLYKKMTGEDGKPEQWDKFITTF